MDKLFLQLLNMSAAAGWLILAVMVLRLFLKNAPGWLTCVLWGIVAIRLLCPFFLESPFSLIPSSQILSPYTVQYAEHPSITSGIPSLNRIVNPVLEDAFAPAPAASANPLHIWITFAGILWSLGFGALILHALASFLRIRKTVEEAVPFEKNIWLCDHIGSPFILGVFRPRVYLPSSITKQELPYVLAHEQAHLKRRDHWWKPFGYLLLSVYWFHPLIWFSYLLFCRDIELACDERVIKDMGLEGKKAYSHALVSLSLHRKLVSACPLAFGESDVKGRIRKVLRYKKPTFWMVMASVVACIVAAVCFLTNPPEKPDESQTITEHARDDKTRVRFQDQWYNKAELSDDTLQWLERYNSLPQDVQLAINYIPWDLNALIYRKDPHTPVALETSTETDENQSDGIKNNELSQSPLDQAICSAIMEKYAHSYAEDYDFACCDFVMLEQVSGTSNSTSHTVVCYGWTFYQQYKVLEAGLENVGGCHIPTALTFEADQGSYVLKEYWEPGAGGDFLPDIQDKFPNHLVSDAIDSQKYIVRQLQSCYSQTIQATGLDTDTVVSRLLDSLSSSLGASFDPQSIPSQQNREYRELLYYGEYTLRYFLGRFDHGEESEPKGKIMALICEELLQTRDTLPINAADADTGQICYDTLHANASSRITPYLSR